MNRAPYVFISYSNRDISTAAVVETVLATNGIFCWIAPRCIPGGSDYATEIPAAIKNCEAFVLILSKESQASTWVPKELDMAITCGKPILPIRIDQSELIPAFSFRLSNVQCVDAFGRLNNACQELAEQIRTYISLPQLKPELEVEPYHVLQPHSDTEPVLIPCRIKGLKTSVGYDTGTLQLYPEKMVFAPNAGHETSIDHRTITGCNWNEAMTGKMTARILAMGCSVLACTLFGLLLFIASNDRDPFALFFIWVLYDMPVLVAFFSQNVRGFGLWCRILTIREGTLQNGKSL